MKRVYTLGPLDVALTDTHFLICWRQVVKYSRRTREGLVAQVAWLEKGVMKADAWARAAEASANTVRELLMAQTERLAEVQANAGDDHQMAIDMCVQRCDAEASRDAALADAARWRDRANRQKDWIHFLATHPDHRVIMVDVMEDGDLVPMLVDGEGNSPVILPAGGAA